MATCDGAAFRATLRRRYGDAGVGVIGSGVVRGQATVDLVKHRDLVVAQ